MTKGRVWWLVAADGRKIGHMWPEDYETALRAHYGRDWVQRFAKDSGLTETSVRRYKDGAVAIPRDIAALVNALGQMAAANLTLEVEKPAWLPAETLAEMA